jgi:CRP/FNR family transcriptional regulator
VAEQTHRKPEAPELGQLFPLLRGGLREELEQAAARMEFEPGEQLYEEGFPCPFVPFLVQGSVRVFKIGESGREITLYRVRPGQVCILSTNCSISDKQYPAIAEAEEHSVVYIVPGGEFRRMLRKYPALQDFVFDLMSERLVEMMAVVEEVTFRRIDLRVLDYLLRSTLPPGSPVVETTHGRLAIELGTSREVISRKLKELERDGYLRLVRGRVEVLDRARLQALRDDLHARLG